MREVRDRRSWSRAQLAERLRARGYAVDALGLARIENGRKAEVDLDLVVGVAYALDVSPLFLMLPDEPTASGSEAERVLVDATAPPVSHYPLRAWLRGQNPLPGQDEVEFFRALPGDELLQRVIEREESTLDRRAAEASVDEMSDDEVAREIELMGGVIRPDQTPGVRRAELILRLQEPARQQRRRRTSGRVPPKKEDEHG
jgi:transcriptional regulator with XRE-family HTH domain